MKVLGFFFSRNMSVEKWHSLGLFDREKLLYEKHIYNNHFDFIYWFTYGANDKSFQKLLPEKIIIVPMPKLYNNKIGILLYTFILPFIHKHQLQKCSVFKNDQMDGAWTAVIAKILYKKKFLLRTGFTLSLFMKQKHSKLKEWITLLIEKNVYNYADFSTVSSYADQQYIQKIHTPKHPIQVIHNYVDTTQFISNHHENSTINRKRIIFIGRLENQKNLFNLIKATTSLSIGLDIYGDGSNKNQLLELVNTINADVTFNGKIPNAEIPRIFANYTFYILPSYYEGMPKTLIEAMACGLICIGTNTSGINEVIQNDHNGFLINGFEAKNIETTLLSILKQNSFERIQSNARDIINTKFSLESYAENEFKIFKRLFNE